MVSLAERRVVSRLVECEKMWNVECEGMWKRGTELLLASLCFKLKVVGVFLLGRVSVRKGAPWRCWESQWWSRRMNYIQDSLTTRVPHTFFVHLAFFQDKRICLFEARYNDKAQSFSPLSRREGISHAIHGNSYRPIGCIWCICWWGNRYSDRGKSSSCHLSVNLGLSCKIPYWLVETIYLSTRPRSFLVTSILPIMFTFVYLDTVHLTIEHVCSNNRTIKKA